MLVLSRECDTSIQIGPNVKIKVLSIQKQRVKLGVEAPNHVRVLRAEIAETDVQEPVEHAPKEDNPFPILVVEDDRAHALIITKALSDCFLSEVSVVTSGEEALRVLGAEETEEHAAPRLIFLDFHLPDMSGLEILRKIRSTPRYRTTPVVLLSSEQRESIVSSCLEAGANAFVSKSVHFEDFRRSVARTAIFWTSECRLPKGASPQPA
jgi:two-component system response regulator